MDKDTAFAKLYGELGYDEWDVRHALDVARWSGRYLLGDDLVVYGTAETYRQRGEFRASEYAIFALPLTAETMERYISGVWPMPVPELPATSPPGGETLPEHLLQTAMAPVEVTAELTRLGYTDDEAEEALAHALAERRYALRDHVLVYGQFGEDGYELYEAVPVQPWRPDAKRMSASEVFEYLTRGAKPGSYPPPVTDELAQVLAAVELVDRWLDETASPEYRDNPLANQWRRLSAGPVMEAAEITEALNLSTGGNPRKGRVKTMDDALAEAADTAFSALLAIQSQTKNVSLTWGIFSQAMAKARSRVPEEIRHAPATGWDH